MDQPANRRRFPRIPMTNAVLVEQLGDKVGEDIAKTHDLSVGGCMFSSSRSFPNGAVIQLLVRIGSEVVEAVARVVYVMPAHEGNFDIGAEFVFIKDRDKDKIASLLD